MHEIHFGLFFKFVDDSKKFIARTKNDLSVINGLNFSIDKTK
jgi:hypothetical protein